jgi:hypothetical protein
MAKRKVDPVRSARAKKAHVTIAQRRASGYYGKTKKKRAKYLQLDTIGAKMYLRFGRRGGRVKIGLSIPLKRLLKRLQG